MEARLRDEGQYIPVYQAIALNPNHVRANQLLADIFLARGEASEARQLLERLYTYHPAAAKHRLVQALLAQAQATKRDKAKLSFYKRVLELEPKQPEAIAEWERIQAATKFPPLRQKVTVHSVFFPPWAPYRTRIQPIK